MANVNPGPAVSGTANSMLETIPVNSGPSANAIPYGSNGQRLIAVVRGLPLSSAGDVAMPTINVTSFVATTVVTTNALVNGVSGTVAAATVGIYTAPAAGGTAVLTTAALTGQTTSAFAYVRAATSVAANTQPAGVLYAHVVTTVAGGTTDLFLYGYDVS